MKKSKTIISVVISFTILFSFVFPQSAPVVDLTAILGDKLDEIKLLFTYPGPDTLPNGSCYYIKYSTYLEGIVWSTTTANVAISTSNVSTGQQQIVVISNLEGNNTYYFHLWISSGPEQILSEISNRATYYLAGEVLMEIQKTYTATTKRPDDEITYIITYKNVGNIKTTWFKIEDKLPANTSYRTNSIKVNNEQKTDDNDEEEGPDAEFTDGKIIILFDDTDSQILPQQTGKVEFKVIIK